jgi:threonine dehydrogenase-like Zn-dependent dehydrogenase
MACTCKLTACQRAGPRVGLSTRGDEQHKGNAVARVLRVGAPGKVTIGEIEAERALTEAEIRLESLMSAISHGTELNEVRGTSPFAGKHFDTGPRAFVDGSDTREHDPDVLGYEMVSVVSEVGAGVAEIRAGDLVHSGTPHQDRTILNVAQQREFGYPVTVLPKDEALEPALFISLGSVALQAIHDGGIKVGDRVLISGLGAIGLMTAQLAALNGASVVIASDPMARRRELAETLGSTKTIDPIAAGNRGGVGLEIKRTLVPGGVDVAIETSGSYAALHAAIASVGVGGRVVSVGFYQGDGIGLRLGEEWHHNRPDLISSMGVWGCPHRNYPLWNRQRLTDEVRDLLYSGKVRTDGLLTHRVAFNDSQHGYDLIMEHPEGVLKIAIVFDAYSAYQAQRACHSTR